MIKWSLFKKNIYVYCLIIKFIYSILYNFSISISLLIIFTNKISFILLIEIFNKLLCTENIPEFTPLIGLLHSPLQRSVGECNISFNIYIVNFTFFLFINNYFKHNLIFTRGVRVLKESDCSISKPLFVIVMFDYNLSSVDLRRGNLISFYKSYLSFNIILLAFLHPGITYVSNPGTVSQLYFKPYTITLNLVLEYLNIREKSLSPKSFKRVCYIITRDLYLLTF